MSKRFRMSTALDVDDLLMECIPYAIRLANEKYNFDPPITIYEVDRWGKLDSRADVIFEFFDDPDFYRNQPVIQGAREFVRKLTKMTDVFVSTSIPPKYMGIRAERIMEEFPEIPPEHMWISSSTTVCTMSSSPTLPIRFSCAVPGTSPLQVCWRSTIMMSS